MAIISPNYKTPKKFTANLSGSLFSYMAPRNNHARIPENTEDKITINIYNEGSFEQFPSSDKYEVFSSTLTRIDWSFWKQKLLIFPTEAAHVVCKSGVFHLLDFSSLFNKKNFEHAVERFIFAHGGSFASSGLCRLNWRIEEFNNTQWIAFENDGRLSSGGRYNPCKSIIQTFYLTPISDEHLLCIYFTQVEQKEANTLKEAFSKLRKFIMSSSELKLSEDAIRQKTEIESQFPQQSYSQTLPPYEFNRMTFPEREQARILLREQRGHDTVNAMSDSAYSSAVDDLEKELRNKYNQQVDDILESHLRFKK